MKRLPVSFILRLLALLPLGCAAFSCSAPSARLTFPTQPISRLGDYVWYDVNRDGKPDFALHLDPTGHVDSLCYDDNEDGTIDRIYRLSDYANRDVPHVIVMLDSIPYQVVADRYAAGDFRYFPAPPQKVIPPFPSLTEISYSDFLGAPPLPGMIDEHYDPRLGRRSNALWKRIEGYHEPWERRLDYCAKFWEFGLSFLNPRPWFAAELERCRAAVDASAYPVDIVYAGSAASMVCKFGRNGANESLDGLNQLCLQLLYERHGAIKLSALADHGHNLTLSKNVPLAQYLSAAGFAPVDQIRAPRDVVIEINGLVTYAAVRTIQPAPVADALLAHPEFQLAMYLEGGRVIVRSSTARAAIDLRSGAVRYLPLEGDPFELKPILDALRSHGKVDADGYVSDADWLAATADAPWPDCPRRVWDAFHRQAVNVPEVMVTLNDGYCAGLSALEHYITMASTHGGLNQCNSATFVMSMENTIDAPIRMRDLLSRLQPGFSPRVHE